MEGAEAEWTYLRCKAEKQVLDAYTGRRVLLSTTLNMGNIESIFRYIFNIEISSIFRWFASIYCHLYVESIDFTSKGYDDDVKNRH